MNSSLSWQLTQIGFRIGGGLQSAEPQLATADIEQTLINALLEFPHDARLASLVFSWIEVHGGHVIVEKLRKLASRYHQDEYPAIAWLSALAAFAAMHFGHKWIKLVKKQARPTLLFPQEVTDSAVALKGAIIWLKELNFILPEGSLRIRPSDIMAPEELVKANRQYRNRYLFGPCWRADIITTIQGGVKSPSEICRILGCSYEPAHRIAHEYAVAAKT